MNGKECPVGGLNLNGLAELMKLGMATPPKEEMAELFHCFVSQAVSEFLGSPLDDCREQSKAEAIDVVELSKGLGEAIVCEAGSVNLLDMIKREAKAQSDISAWPEEIMRVCYYGAIAAALLRHNKRISRLEPDVLAEGIEWAGRRKWIIPEWEVLFRQARNKILSPAEL